MGAPQLGNGFAQFLEERISTAEMDVVVAAIGTVLAICGIGLAYLMYSAHAISAAGADGASARST